MAACKSAPVSAAAAGQSAGLMPLAAPTGNGKRFGTRDTRDCALTVDHPTPAQLQQIFTCEMENVVVSASFGDSIDLVSNVALQFSKPRPFNMNTDSFQHVDVTQPVFDARGSYVHWQCWTWTADPNPRLPQPGNNCYKHVAPRASGIAYRDTFGNWHVPMIGEITDTMHYYPPPTEF